MRRLWWRAFDRVSYWILFVSSIGFSISPTISGGRGAVHRATTAQDADANEGRLEALHVAEEIGGTLLPAGQVRFGLWGVLDQLRSGKPVKGIIPVRPLLMTEIKFYGRHKGGSIRDGVLVDLIDSRATFRMPSKIPRRLWDCDSDAAVAAMCTELAYNLES